MKKATHEEYIRKVKNINSNIEVLGRYVNARTKILHKCNICGYEWEAKPSGVLSGYGCPSCAGVKHITQEEYEKRIREANPYIRVCGEYINSHTSILHKCEKCGYEWMVKPMSISVRYRCPVCSKKRIGLPPEYKNSIWAQEEYRDFFKDYISEVQMKSNTPHSNSKINMTCKYCGRSKYISPNKLIKQGFGCICGDGVSYPNKFMFSLLEQTGTVFNKEKSFEWSNGKIYDFYIPSLNCIIECHGGQHYTNGFITYEAVKQNDEYKEEMAKDNGIQYYVVIDCRKSDKDWIKQYVLDSILPSILEFTEHDIDWYRCDEFATSNLVKKISQLWNDGMCIKQIMETTKLSKNTVRNYLNKGAKFLMCDYTGDLSRKRSMQYRSNKRLGG